MRLKINSFGLLVRPRILINTKVLPINKDEKDDILKFEDELSYIVSYSNRRLNVKDRLYEEVFQDLDIGDTTKDLSTCYIGVIESFITSINYRRYILVDKNNVNDIIETFSKKYNSTRISMPIYAVGLKFYKGLKIDENGKFIPINPWEGTKNDTFFYYPWDLLSIEDIIKYEKAKLGSLLLFKRTMAMIIKKKTIKKRRFYKTNSWSSKSITILMSDGRRIRKFLPNRWFKEVDTS